MARREVNLHGCAPISRGPFPQIPAFEGRCIRSVFVALPHRSEAESPSEPGAFGPGAPLSCGRKKTPDAMSSPGFFSVDGAGDGI